MSQKLTLSSAHPSTVQSYKQSVLVMQRKKRPFLWEVSMKAFKEGFHWIFKNKLDFKTTVTVKRNNNSNSGRLRHCKMLNIIIFLRLFQGFNIKYNVYIDVIS